ncbi:DUF6498-containing protein [Salinirubellus sp. GCM10025818]|uniref:DUF6498-containing protein n=1 Tax=Salinirubellus TaxID=2162630 RepID=UPI0030D44BB7
MATDGVGGIGGLLPRLARSRRAALVALVAANSVPLLGVLLLGWSMQGLLLVYWLESGVVGAFNVPKILYAHGTETDETRSAAKRLKSNGRTVTLPDAPDEIPDAPTRRPENRAVARFFLGHYGLFWAVHGLFVGLLPLFADGAGILGLAELPTLVLGAGAAAVSHGVSYRRNYLDDGEWKHVSPGGRMYAPYDRVLVMHLTIVVGAFAVSFLGTPAGALAVMVLVKTALDARAHLREHDREKPAGRSAEVTETVSP